MTPNLQIVRTILGVLLYLTASGTQAFAQFETRASVSTYPFAPLALAVGDFNRDGNLDVALVNYLPSGNVMILLGNGDGTFTLGASYAVGRQPESLAAASFRNNGILDLVVGDSDTSDYIHVMLGNGDGTFQPAIAYPTVGEPNRVATGDFTADGKIDVIALAEAGCNCVEVLPGNGDGTFQPPVVTAVPYNISGVAITAAHFNEDSKLDVAVSGFFGTAAQVDILLGNGDGTFRPHGYYAVASAAYSVAVGPFNGDKAIDLAAGDVSSVSVLLGTGNGTFQQAVNYDALFPEWVAVADLNGDGKEDLAIANLGTSTDPPAASVSVMLGNGDGTFQPGAVYPGGGDLFYVVIGDFNGDGKPDLVAADGLFGSVITLLNTGTAAFSPTTPITFLTQRIGSTGAPQSVTLTNNGTSPLTISSVTSSGEPFKMQTTCKGVVAPGGNCTISATFTPQVAGTANGTIAIRDSASTKPQVVELVGTGTEVELKPAQLSFPPQKVGTKSATKNIRLTNLGSTVLDFTSITIQSSFSSFSETNNCLPSINAGASCFIQVTFAPHRTGLLTANLLITDTGGGSPQTVPLSGTGD